MSGETGDLRDRRDASIREIAKHFQINAYEDGKGHYNVNVVGGGTLVSGGKVSVLEARKTPAYDSRTRKDEGNIEVFFKGRTSTPLSQFLKKGETKALIETRNVEIDILREQIDSLAYNLAKSTNAIHQKGFAHKEVLSTAFSF
jgi:flagellar hook-associated protein FlgK